LDLVSCSLVSYFFSYRCMRRYVFLAFFLSFFISFVQSFFREFFISLFIYLFTSFVNDLFRYACSDFVR